MSEIYSPNEHEQDAHKYQSAYYEQAKQKSSELGPGSSNYPYKVEFETEGQKVLLCGMKHVNNPSDESLKRLEDLFQPFVESAERPIVFVEGGKPSVEAKSIDQATRQHGEVGFLTKLAEQNNIEVISPEPPPNEEIENLLKYFSPDEIMQYYFNRSLFQWYRNGRNDPDIGDYQSYVDRHLENASRLPALKGGYKGYDYYADQFAQKYGQLPEEMSDDKAYDLLHVEASPENPVSAANSDFRDKYIYDQILEEAKKDRDVFVAYGSHHVFVWEQMAVSST